MEYHTKYERCPVCGSDNIIYGSMEVQDNSVYFEITCQECEFQGKEWHHLVFDCYSD